MQEGQWAGAAVSGWGHPGSEALHLAIAFCLPARPKNRNATISRPVVCRGWPCASPDNWPQGMCVCAGWFEKCVMEILYRTR